MRDRGQVYFIGEKKRARRKGALLAVLGAALIASSIVLGGAPLVLP